MDIQGPRARAEKFLSKEWQTWQDGRNLANDVIGLTDYIDQIQQEQAEREKGCSLCHGEQLQNVTIVNHWGEDQIALVSGRVDEKEQFAFCPKCGRRLK